MGFIGKQTLVSYQCCQQVIHSLSQTQFSHLYNGNSNIGLRRWIESCPRFLSRILHSLVYSPWIFPGTFIPLVALRLGGRVARSVLLFVVVQSPSRFWVFASPWSAACEASQSFTISQSLLKLMSIESMVPSNHLVNMKSNKMSFTLEAYSSMLSLKLGFPLTLPTGKSVNVFNFVSQEITLVDKNL